MFAGAGELLKYTGLQVLKRNKPFLYFFGVVLFVEESLLRFLSYWTACWRVNQSSVLPSHATTTSQAGIPHDGLLRTPKDPICGAFESERNRGYRFTRIQSQLHIRGGDFSWQGTAVGASVTRGHG